MRPYFYHYPDDSMCWNISDSYLFGADVLVAPVLEAGTVTREVYLPKGDNWIEVSTQKIWTGGQWIEANAPIDVIPVFVREGTEVEGLNA